MKGETEKPPHILMLSSLFPPFKGAAASRLFSLAKYWGKKTRVTVVTCQKPVKQVSFKQIRFPLTFSGYDFLRIPFLFRRLLRIVRTLNVNVVFASIPTPWSLFEAYLLSKRLGIPLITDIRDLPNATYPVDRWGNLGIKLYNILRRSISIHIARKSARVVTVTEIFKDELLKLIDFPEDKIHIIRNGSEVKSYKIALSKEKKYDLVYSGTLIAVRNPQFMLDFARFLRKFHSELRILFISNLKTSLGEGFLEGIKRYGLQENFEFTEMVSQDQLPHLIGQARLGWTSLRYGEYYFRGVVSAKNYEYLAAGLPIMGLLDPDYYIEAGRLITDNRVGFLDPDPASLAQKTVNLLKDKTRLERMSKRARKVGERFDRKKLAEEFYDKVIIPVWRESRASR